MRYYPVCLDIKDRRCLVVGGGQVGTRKVRTLLDCGARVSVVSPKATETLTELAARGQIALSLRDYRSDDQNGAFLVIGATNDASLNQRIHEDAETAGRLCNIADQPQRCNFIVPSVIQQGDLQLTISTSGKSPAFARHLRRQLQAQFGPEYGLFLELMGAIRQRLLAQAHAPEAHKQVFERLISEDLLGLIRSNDHRKIDTILAEVVGADFLYADLMS